MAKIKKAQAGIARSFLGKYMGEAAEHALQKKLYNIAEKKFMQEAAIDNSTKQITRRMPAAERNAIESERIAQRKAAGLRTNDDFWAEKRPMSERFSGAREDFYNTSRTKGKQVPKGANTSKKGIIDKQQGYEERKNGGKIKKAQYGSSTSKDKSGKYTVVTKSNTADGPRYYTATHTNENTARMLNNARARSNSADSTRAKDVDPIDIKALANQRNGGKTIKKASSGKQMIKRADGSTSQRGLWDNIRANKGSGKKPTSAMLKQERKIKAKTKK